MENTQSTDSLRSVNIDCSYSELIAVIIDEIDTKKIQHMMHLKPVTSVLWSDSDRSKPD